MYKKIMVAVDGSLIATSALEQAIALAKRDGAEVMAVHVVEYPHTYIEGLGYDPAAVVDPLIRDCKSVLERAESLMQERHIRPQSQLIDDRMTLDSVAEQMLKAADAYNADLVVLATHGRGGYKRLLLGSVAQDFLRLSHCPVLLVPAKRQEAGPPE